MNHLTKITLSLFFVSLFTIGTSFSQSTETKNEKTVQIKVTGMTCGGCSNHVSKVLTETPGVIDNSVVYPGNIAEVKYDADQVSPAIIAQAIEEKTSYKAKVIESKTKKKS